MAKTTRPRAKRHKSAAAGVPRPAPLRQARGIAKPAPSGIAGQIWPRLSASLEAQALALQFQFQQTEWWPPDRLLAHQLRQLQGLIDHAHANVPFYRDRLDGLAGLPPEALTLERFRAVPMLTRDEVREAGSRLHARRLPAGHAPTFPIYTSGSSGKPIQILGTPLTGVMLSALTMRGHLWHKRDLSAKNLTIRRPRKPGLDVKPTRWAPLPQTGPNYLFDIAQPTARLFEVLLRHDPAYLQSHPNLILGLLRISEQTGRKPVKLREVRTYGESLDSWLRDYCREIWGVPMVDNYSSEELNTVALQCPESDNLHVQSENVLVEVIDADGRLCPPGTTGTMVATSLVNYATPMIRYELGDMVEVGDPCACGRGLPVLTRVVGRIVDLVELPNGDKVFPMIYKELMDFPKIQQYQLIQPALERLELKLVVGAPLDDAERRGVVEVLQRKLTYAFGVELTFVDDIPREASGKYHEFRSELPGRAGETG